MDIGAWGEIALINDPAGTSDQHALLIEVEKAHSHRPRATASDADSLLLNGQPMRVTAAKRLADLPLAQMAIDLVFDSTG